MYKARNQLAALDYQLHNDWLPRKNKKGELVYKRKFNKCSSRWTTYPEKCEKTYYYIEEIITSIVDLFENIESVKRPPRPQPFDPKMISPTIAPIAPPKIGDLVAQHKSQFT